jgi:hypothetical protein
MAVKVATVVYQSIVVDAHHDIVASHYLVLAIDMRDGVFKDNENMHILPNMMWVAPYLSLSS